MNILAYLRNTLLRAGGRDVKINQRIFGMAYTLLKHGKFYSGESVLRLSVLDGAQLIYGLALCDDEQWREHSWHIFDGEVIEPATPHHLYYGCLVSELERPTNHISEEYVERVHRTLIIGEEMIENV